MANPSPDKGNVNARAPDDYLAWWTSIETDLRKSLLVGARRDPERLHNLLRTAFEAGQASVTPPSPSTAPEVGGTLVDVAMHAHMDAARKGINLYGCIQTSLAAALASRPAEVDDPGAEAGGRDGAEQAETRMETGSQPVGTLALEVDDEGLPPLPRPAYYDRVTARMSGDGIGYTAEQYRQGQRDAVAADRARRDDMGADGREWFVVGGRRVGRTYLAKMHQDAERYRFLRNSWVHWSGGPPSGTPIYYKTAKLDEKVDAAIRAVLEGDA